VVDLSRELWSLRSSWEIGCKSFMVKHIVHLNTCSSLGHRTKEPQVMQCPVAKSLLPEFCPFFCERWDWCCSLLFGFDIRASSSVESESSESSDVCLTGCFFFLLANSGKGWLSDRPCRGMAGLEGALGFEGCSRSSSEELETCSCEPSTTSNSDMRAT